MFNPSPKMTKDATVEKAQTFTDIVNRFSANIQALRVLSEQISPHADAHDAEAMRRFTERMELALPSRADASVPNEQSPSQSEEGRNDGDGATEEGADQAHLDVLRAKLREPSVLRAVMEAVNSFTKQAPKQGALIRQSALVTLMSHFESLIADLTHAFYVRFPRALSADQRSLTLEQLRELGSIDDAVSYLVAQEVDALLREPLDRQIAYFTKPLGVDTRPLEHLCTRLVEIDQRRNLFVHNRGVVNRHYTKRVAVALQSEFSIEDGSRLTVSDEYLRYAVDTVLASGIILGIQCWGKWAKKETEERDSVLVSATFDALQEGRSELVCHIALFGTSGAATSDLHRRILAVNYACALYAKGDEKGMHEVLGTHDWSAASLKFQLAISSLTGDSERFFRLLPKAFAAEDVLRHEIEEWPVYARARGFEGLLASLDHVSPKAIALLAEASPPLESLELATDRANYDPERAQGA